MNIFKQFRWSIIVFVTILGLVSVLYFFVPFHNMADISTLEKNNVDICSAWRGADKRALRTVPWWGRACDMASDWTVRRYNCKDNRRMGNWPVCFDNNLVPQNNCLVYSFGIDNDFSFDDAMAAIGCTVYSFDPSMLDTADHKRGDRVFFQRIGISDKDDDHFVPRADEYVEQRPAVNGWPMRRLQTILDLLGHRKFLVEWHLFTDFPPRERVPDAVDTYFRLNDMGFQLFVTGGVQHGFHSASRFRIQAEVAYLNMKIN
ncbi:uncharacterized protein LOC112553316 isoform X3 [Pomacea canaliculata]|uniref:uncharacterized protein LOC112553316 isoform X3 n=1 Tax=Pomacea canaliculata TaxID=400727 RepID=UPI000D737704|nr:uncharacterized protein LOC112553316 isoform X3 [Pomacea canaliculata]